MKTTRRQFAASLIAGGVSLFIPKVITPTKWKFSPNPARECNYLFIAARKIDPLPVEPGTVYFNTATQSFRTYDGQRWVEYLGPRKDKLVLGVNL